MSGKTRTLKIEAVGDFAGRRVRPRIRLGGQWLERAGFKPGEHVSVNCVASGIMELHSASTPLALNETPP